jgi:hypothetical protein
MELRHAEKLLNLFSRLLADYEKRRRHEAMGGAPDLTFKGPPSGPPMSRF